MSTSKCAAGPIYVTPTLRFISDDSRRQTSIGGVQSRFKARPLGDSHANARTHISAAKLNRVGDCSYNTRAPAR